ncbi:DUF2231 domain-containing protein [Sulfurirhabdus autotrophica]|uniref:Putative membrane protein n=1 Tax=Sulfurirhabdus autotrophica TaxID=1706046 RepID=A0A4R3YGA6_9PROT|nr:DUF2231 domain-containing protein [Sulfurirhabdus autotrophica]TCV90248.1 putative membrane protein [Sulfurirhabdus autotrophica]
MIQIIPNWHPVFVHFTVALLSLAVFFSLTTMLLRPGNLKVQWQVMARWNLWLGTAISILTAIAGWDAYNTVAHDAPSHVAMTEHRNWALATLSVFIILTAWSLWNTRKQRKAGVLFAVLMFTGGALLASTAWHGGEVVYRFGLGVMSLPQAEEEGGDETHGHEHGHAHGAVSDIKKSAEQTAEQTTKTIPEVSLETKAIQPQPTEKPPKKVHDSHDGHTHEH